MQEKSWIEIFEELGLDTDIFDDEKWDKMIKRHMEYKGSNFSMKIGGTVYDVTTHFNPNGRESLFKQILDIILSANFDDFSKL